MAKAKFSGVEVTPYGNVTVSFVANDGTKYNKVTKHNTGTVNMCSYLIDCLIGSYNSNNRPTQIQLLRKKGSEYEPFFADGSGISVNNYFNKTITDNENEISSSITMSFMIPSMLLSGRDFISGVALMSPGKSDDSTKLAEVHFNGDGIAIEEGINIEIDWTLKVAVTKEVA